MKARDFYNKRNQEDETIGSVELMDEYAKHIIELSFCDNTPIDFKECKVGDLEKIYEKINKLVDWVNE